MIGAKLGHFLDKPLTPLVKKIPLNPNILTAAGFVITVAAAFVLPYNIRLGGLLILTGGLFDMLDGVSARVNNKVTKFELSLILCLTGILMRFSFFLLHGILLQKASIQGHS